MKQRSIGIQKKKKAVIYKLEEGFPYYLFSFNTFDSSSSQASNSDPWKEILKTSQENIRVCGAEHRLICEGMKVREKESIQEYNGLKKRVMNKKATARSIIGCDENQNFSLEEINKLYKKFAFLTHPDKLANCSEALKKEAEVLFKLIGNVIEMLKEERKTQYI